MADGLDWESLAEAASGAVGALVSTAVLHPLDTCKTRYQAEVQSHGHRKYRCKVMIQSADADDNTIPETHSKPPRTVIDALTFIWKKEGFPGFFKGPQAQILQTVLSSALLLMIKEKLSMYAWISLLAIRRFLRVSQ